MCAQKLTDASLIYRTEPETKNRKELKSKMDMLRRNGTGPETVESARRKDKRSKNFDKKPNRRQKILRRSQDRGKAVDNGLSVGKVVQFLLHGKNASSVSCEYVRHARMSTGDNFVRTVPNVRRH